MSLSCHDLQNHSKTPYKSLIDTVKHILHYIDTKDIEVRQILQELITHLREVGDIMEAVQVTIEKGLKIHDDFTAMPLYKKITP